jgi:hypothetical protein
MNWGSLKQLARTYVHRSDLDFDALQPLAWSNISIALVVPENEAMSVVTLSGPDDKTLFSGALPVDYALMRAVSQTGRTLNPVDIKMLIERGGSLVYSQRLQPVLDDESSNIILDHYPDICLYGLLKHAAAIVQDPEVNAEFYEQQFLGAVKTANSIYIDAAFGPGTAATPMGGMM